MYENLYLLMAYCSTAAKMTNYLFLSWFWVYKDQNCKATSIFWQMDENLIFLGKMEDNLILFVKWTSILNGNCYIFWKMDDDFNFKENDLNNVKINRRQLLLMEDDPIVFSMKHHLR